MVERNFNELFKSKKHAVWSIVLSLVILLVYKYYKYALKNHFFTFDDDYLVRETFHTFYRIFSSVTGVLICAWVYKSVRPMIQKEKRSFWFFFFSYLTAYALVYSSTHSFAFSSLTSFSWEAFFNIFTGLSEEYQFRGLLLGGIAYFVKPIWSIFISSLIFSLWHIDVYQEPVALLSIFFFSLVFSQGYRLGFSLFGIAMIHFLVDQFHFGFSWSDGHAYHNYFMIFLNLITVIVLEKFRTKPLSS